MRGNGILPVSRIRASPACGPDTRTIAIALGGLPDDNAKMVWSRECIGLLVRFEPEQQCRFRVPSTITRFQLPLMLHRNIRGLEHLDLRVT
jgi:hypothetical protein